MTAAVRSFPETYDEQDWFALTTYCRIRRLNDAAHPGCFIVDTRDGQRWAISKQVVARTAWHPRHYARAERVSTTRIGEVLADAGDAVFTVQFRKQTSAQFVAGELTGLTATDVASTARRLALARTLLKGERRRLTGHLVRTDARLGRYLVRDLDVRTPGSDFRWIDGRTIEWLILKGVKYTVSA